MLKRLWIIFCQSVTIAIAIFFVIKILNPDLINKSRSEINTTIVQSNNTNKQIASQTYRNAAIKAMPSVVNIFTHSKIQIRQETIDPLFDFFFNGNPNRNLPDRSPQKDDVSSLGSGVIVTADGYILTNNHVIKGADSIEVALHDGRTVNAKIIGTDPESDLAVLKINLQSLPFINFAAPNNIEVGDVVLAIGNPFGVGQTTTMGIVSALKRNHLGINTFENFIQTDAAINPGNSGGALIDTNGNLVGINTAIFSKSGGNQGIGFAIPAIIAKQVMEQLIKGGEVVRGWIGVMPKDIDQQLIDALGLGKNVGAFIAKIVENGPAERAGIKAGDIIIKIHNQDVKDTASLLNIVSQIEPNITVECKIMRQQKLLNINIKIGKRPNIDKYTKPSEAE